MMTVINCAMKSKQYMMLVLVHSRKLGCLLLKHAYGNSSNISYVQELAQPIVPGHDCKR